MTTFPIIDNNEFCADEVKFPPRDIWSEEPPLESYAHLQQILILLQSLEWLWQDRNDYFTPNINGNITIEYLQVFNRWGEKVYEHSPLSKGWDGSYQSKPAAKELYTYTLRYFYLGRVFTKSGEVMVF